MLSWPAVSLPFLPRLDRELALYDTASASLMPTGVGDVATMYVCGITPYDATHIGHAATYVAFDTVNRFWRATGHGVRYAQNITDIDDPLLERAARDGIDWRELAAAEIQRFRDDMTALRVLPPDFYIGAVESIPLAAAAVASLQERRATYELGDDRYFAVAADPHFGMVSHLSAEEMVDLSAQRGGDPQRPGKQNPVDAVVWQAERPGEPAWDTAVGRGRPGWHIECAAIALEYLGSTIDVQGGGRDLIFPHHEFSASQARTITGQPLARLYVHSGMVGFGGEKMSKSRGNLVFVSRLRESGTDPMAIRLALLANHYRADWEWTPELLQSAQQRLHAWRDALSWPTGPAAERVAEEVVDAVSDDLDTPAALAAVDRWAEEQRLRGGADPSAPGLLSRTIDALLGIA